MHSSGEAVDEAAVCVPRAGATGAGAGAAVSGAADRSSAAAGDAAAASSAVGDAAADHADGRDDEATDDVDDEPDDGRRRAALECNICLDVAADPVLTTCGHIYCWPCIYQWMESMADGAHLCPVCKAVVSPDKCIPIYGRDTGKTKPSSSSGTRQRKPQSAQAGASAAAASSAGATVDQAGAADAADAQQQPQDAAGGAPGTQIPHRPAGQREEAPPNDPYNGRGFNPFQPFMPMGGHGAGIAFHAGVFPFGFGFVGGNIGLGGHGQPLTRAQQEQMQNARVFMAIAVVVMLIIMFG